jgi:ubiquinone/menaquinone biosynthesis C-methylase UbiE
MGRGALDSILGKENNAMTTSDPHGQHDWHSQQYVEDWIASSATRDEVRRIILRRVVSLIPREADAAIRVLDVGAGYGALSAQVLERFPQAQLVCQDFSEPMFAQARKRLAWASDRVAFTHSDLSDPGWTHALAGPFDAVVSAIAIHNVRYPERIRAIYSEIFDVVAPGGCFLNYDLIFVSGPAAAAAYDNARGLEGWVQGADGDASPPQAGATERSAHDRETITLEQQLGWLREGGFQDVECFWKEMRSAIIGGFRPLDT